MFKRLKQHWKVNNKDLVLILFTFAITGSVTAYISRQISEWLQLEKYSFTWWTSKIAVLFFGYQILILFFGFCLGQFQFFWNYEKKILRRFGFRKLQATGNRKQEIKHIAIFASGTGSNAQKIIDHFKNSVVATVELIVCNNAEAGVLEIAKKENIPFCLLDKNKFYGHGYVDELRKYKIELIVLAGFLWKLPAVLINAYPDKIINIHPALLPKFGGKGMYGSKVHEAVIAAKEKQSGISIHYVDELYDHGKIIFQSTCSIDETDTAETLAKKIRMLEHEHYPKIIEQVLQMPNQR